MTAARLIALVTTVLVVGPLLAGAEDRTAAPGPGGAAPGGIDGEKLFATACGWCHQDGGRAAGRGPKLAGSDRTDEYLLNRIRVGKEGAMPAFGRTFTESQLRAIVAYIRGLKDVPH